MLKLATIKMGVANVSVPTTYFLILKKYNCIVLASEIIKITYISMHKIDYWTLFFNKKINTLNLPLVKPSIFLS
tara:strand:- start:1785 stop:2006 length:222 start_codon:yes stop_codon:yes gene_type:complete